MMNRFAMAGLAACLGAYAGPLMAQEGVSADSIKLGGTNASTGPVAAVCTATQLAQEASMKKLNDAGGIAGRTIEYNVLDDGYSAQRAIGNIRRLIQQDGVFAVFGGCGTATAAAALSALENTDVPYLFPYAGLDRLVVPPKENVFSLLPQYTTQLATILPHVIEVGKPKTAALFTFNIAGHEQVVETAKAKLQAAGVEVVGEALMEVGSPDRSSFALQAKDLQPDLLVLNDSAPGAARFLLELERQGWRPKYVTGVSTLTDESFLRAVGEAANDILIAPGIVIPPDQPGAEECVETMRAYDSSVDPSHFTMFGCLTVKVLAAALENVGENLDRPALIKALEGLNGFETGISGNVTFSPEKRMGLESLFVISVENGKFVVGDSLPVAQ